MQLFCDGWIRNFNLLDASEDQAVQASSRIGRISALHKTVRKGVLKTILSV